MRKHARPNNLMHGEWLFQTPVWILDLASNLIEIYSMNNIIVLCIPMNSIKIPANKLEFTWLLIGNA